MRYLIIFLFILVSFSCIAQKVEYDSLPIVIQKQINIIKFKSAIKIGDSWYEIKYKGLKKKEYCTINGIFESNYNYKGSGGTIFGWNIFTSIIIVFTLMLVPH